MRGVFINRPWFWLLFQGAGLLIIFLRYETFQLIPVDVDGYWFWAKNLDWLSLTDVLSIRRTFGYPLFLRCVHLFSRSLTALPICQLVLRLLAVFVFYWGLRHLKLSSWLALFVSSSLFYPETVPFAGDQLTSRLMSDSPAQSLAIMTIGLLLIVIGRPRSALAWLGLLLSLFLTYQTRPIYLFLVLLVPLLGILVTALLARRAERVHQIKRLGLGLIAVCLLPFLAWCTLRWAKVGQFGLVSIGGSSLVGIAGQVLTEELVPKLPEDVRPLAFRALEERKNWSAGQKLVFEGSWQPPMDSDNKLRPGVVEDGTTAVNTQFLFEGVANELYGYNDVLVNSKLKELSWAIIKAKPRFYLLWLVESFRVAVIGVIAYNYLCGSLMVLLAVLLGIWCVAFADNYLRMVTAGRKWIPQADYSLQMLSLLLIAVSFAFAKILVIVPVATPERRYLAAAGVFLTPVAVLVPFAVWGQIRRRLPLART